MRKLEKHAAAVHQRKKVVTFVFLVLFGSQAARWQHFIAVDWAGTAHCDDVRTRKQNSDGCVAGASRRCCQSIDWIKVSADRRWRCPLLRQTICWSSGRGQSDFYSLVVTEFNNNFIVLVERQGTRWNSHSSEPRCRWFLDIQSGVGEFHRL